MYWYILTFKLKLEIINLLKVKQSLGIKQRSFRGEPYYVYQFLREGHV